MGRPALVTVARQALEAVGCPSAGETLVVGVSGGADSVALLDVLVTLGRERGFAVEAAHLDHGLRADSADDAAFCRQLCRALGVRLHEGSADVASRARRERRGLEDAARRERYAFLRRVRRAAGARAIAVAHTRDDQAETVLLRLLRGAGPAGLAAMRPRRGRLLRPLLAASRQQVLAHLGERGLAWRDDATNADPRFARNRVRTELLPYLEQRFNPRVREALASTAALAAEESDLAGKQARAWLARHARRDGDAFVVPLPGLARRPKALARRILLGALVAAGAPGGRVHVERLLALCRGGRASGRRLSLPEGREAVFRFDELRIGPARARRPSFAATLGVPGRVSLPDGGAIVARPAAGPAAEGARRAVLAAPEGPLTVRTRRPGDRVRSGGRRVSLKRWLMGGRVPHDVRGELPLVVAGSEVLWVPGLARQPGHAQARRFVEVELVEGAR